MYVHTISIYICACVEEYKVTQSPTYIYSCLYLTLIHALAILLHVIFVSFTVCFIGLHTKRLMIEMESRQQLASEIHVEAAAGEVAALDRDNRNGGNDDGDGLHGGNGNGGDGNGADELMVGRIDHNRAREYWRRIQGQYLARTSGTSILLVPSITAVVYREGSRMHCSIYFNIVKHVAQNCETLFFFFELTFNPAFYHHQFKRQVYIYRSAYSHIFAQ